MGKASNTMRSAAVIELGHLIQRGMQLPAQGDAQEYLADIEAELDRLRNLAEAKCEWTEPRKMAEWIVSEWRSVRGSDRMLVIAITEALKVVPAVVGGLEAEIADLRRGMTCRRCGHPPKGPADGK